MSSGMETLCSRSEENLVLWSQLDKDNGTASLNTTSF